MDEQASFSGKDHRRITPALALARTRSLSRLRKSKNDWACGMELLPFDHQREAFNTILTRAKLFFEQRWLEFPIRPKFHSLLCGPTGTGKTTIASHVASVLRTGFFRISCPGWMPMGAHNRGSAETFPLVMKHLESKENSVLFLDEIDKLWDVNSSWQDYARSEIFDLLDGKIPNGIKLDEDCDARITTAMRMASLSRKLTRHTFIISAGTFQSHWEKTSALPIGFGSTNRPTFQPSLSATDIARRLPRELANRFHSETLILRQLERSDYLELAHASSRLLPEWIRGEFCKVAFSKIDQALEAHKGCRYIEEALLLALQFTSEKETQMKQPVL